MKQLLLMSSLFLASCGQAVKTQVIEKEVFVKCPVPDIPKVERQAYFSDIDNLTYPEKLRRILRYVLDLEQENRALREVLEVCRDEAVR